MKSYRTYLFGALPLLMTGCWREEPCPAPADSSLSFVYVGDGDADIFPSRIHSVEVFVFGENGDYLECRRLEKSALRTRQGIDLPLPDGSYRVVLWGNIGGETRVFSRGPGDRIENYFVAPARYGEYDDYSSHDPLYYAACELTVSGEPAEETVEFRSAHIKTDLHIKRYREDDPEDASYPSVIIRNSPETNDFAMNPPDGSSPVIPEFYPDPSDRARHAESSLLRFPDRNNLEVALVDPDGNDIASFGLAGFMEKFGWTVEAKQEARISLYLTFRNSEIQLGIDGWDSEEIIPEITYNH